MARKAPNLPSEGNRVLRLLLYVMVLTSLYCVVYVLNQGDLHSYMKSPFFTAAKGRTLEGNTKATPGFMIDTPSCKIPEVEPFDSSIKMFLKSPSRIICNDKPPLLYTEGQMLKVNHKALSVYGISNVTMLKCCYQKLVRVQQHPNHYNKDADNQYKVAQSCVKFEEEARIHDEFIRIVCKFRGKEVYKNFYAFFAMKSSVTQKIQRQHITEASISSSESPTTPPLSVLLVGIDSVSRLNMLRYLNKTATLLRNKGAIELNGFVKVGDNTFPNLIPELTGLEPKDLTKMCWKSAYKKLDNCPFLWKNFSIKGYVTAYSEDTPMIGIFNYHKTGFVVPPGDFYLRPVVLASNKELPTKERDGFNVCVGDRLMVDVILDHATQFAHVFKDSPYFGLFWTNSLTHNNVNSAATADEPYLRFFQNLFEDPDTLNRTLLLFFSDHGMRFGRIRETYLGWLEERMPFFTIWLPEWFHSRYPEAVTNLKINARRLTSPFDVYRTLTAVLENRFASDFPSSGKGQSLFQEVPLQRTCADAGIAQHWCTCQESQKVHRGAREVKMSVAFTLDHLNMYLSAHNKCASLQLEEVVSSRMFQSHIIPSSYSVVKRDKVVSDYVIAFKTVPGDAVFEATVRFSPETERFTLMGPISRISRYDGMSDCVDDFELRKYCFCVQQPQTRTLL